MPAAQKKYTSHRTQPTHKSLYITSPSLDLATYPRAPNYTWLNNTSVITASSPQTHWCYAQKYTHTPPSHMIIKKPHTMSQCHIRRKTHHPPPSLWPPPISLSHIQEKSIFNHSTSPSQKPEPPSSKKRMQSKAIIPPSLRHTTPLKVTTTLHPLQLNACFKCIRKGHVQELLQNTPIKRKALLAQKSTGVWTRSQTAFSDRKKSMRQINIPFHFSLLFRPIQP